MVSGRKSFSQVPRHTLHWNISTEYTLLGVSSFSRFFVEKNLGSSPGLLGQ